MTPLSKEFIDKCPIENGFRMRGTAMTRAEVFVDAAFAFAVTMLVISIDQIPKSVPELLEVSKHIPAFILSVAQIVWIWHSQSVWSKRFGLEDGKSIILSMTLLIVVLIYIYPMKMMFEGLFAWLTMGYLPSDFQLKSYDELRYLFAYFATIMGTIALIFMGLHKRVLSLKNSLRLSEEEVFKTESIVMHHWGGAFVCVVALASPFMVANEYVPYTGFSYALLGVVDYSIEKHRFKIWNARHGTEK